MSCKGLEEDKEVGDPLPVMKNRDMQRWAPGVVVLLTGYVADRLAPLFPSKGPATLFLAPSKLKPWICGMWLEAPLSFNYHSWSIDRISSLVVCLAGSQSEIDGNKFYGT